MSETVTRIRTTVKAGVGVMATSTLKTFALRINKMHPPGPSRYLSWKIPILTSFSGAKTENCWALLPSTIKILITTFNQYPLN